MRNTATAVLLLTAATLGGCAIGRTADGGAVIGTRLGTHPDESAITAVGGAIGSIFGPGGAVIGGGIATAVVSVLGLNARNSTKRRQAEAEAAELRGREYGWMDAVGSGARPAGDVDGRPGVVGVESA